MPEFGTQKKQYVDTAKHIERVSNYKKHQEKYWRKDNAELLKEDEGKKNAEPETVRIGEGIRIQKT